MTYEEKKALRDTLGKLYLDARKRGALDLALAYGWSILRLGAALLLREDL